MTRATLELHNQPQHLFLRNINVMQTSAIGPALKMHFDLLRKMSVVNLWPAGTRCFPRPMFMPSMKTGGEVPWISTGLITKP